MSKILISIRRLVIAAWFGQMLFFAVQFAPKVFKVLPRIEAANLQNSLFPNYFLFGIIFGAIALLTLIIQKSWNSKSIGNIRFLALLVMLTISSGIFTYGYFSITPTIRDLQSEMFRIAPDVSGTSAELLTRPMSEDDRNKVENFQRTHKLSVKLNGLVLILLFILVII